jgi:arylsulfatase A-like enzyme
MRASLAGAALLALVAAACGPPPPRGPRLVLLYATCTLNRSFLEPYDSRVAYTPNLAAFARSGVVFERHHSETDQSGPAYASILSGAQVDRHGIYRHPARLPDALHLAAEAFAARGYETHFWSGHPMASADLNYGQGVPPENVNTRRPGQADLYALTGSDDAFRRILRRLKERPSARAYVQVLFTITHGPYTPVDPRAVARFRKDHPADWPTLSDADVARYVALYNANYLRMQWDFPRLRAELHLGPSEVAGLAAVLEAYYKVSVRLLDHSFGRVIDAIGEAGLLEESLIAFTSDHGETLYRPDALFKWTHGLEADVESLRVPLLVRLPGEEPRKGRYEGVSRSIDVYPTLAGLAGFTVGAASGVDGVDLSRAVRGEAPAPSLRAFSHTTLLGPELVEQFKGWKVSEYHPTVEKDHLWVAVLDRDLFARYRKLDGGGFGVVLQSLADGRIEPVAFDPAVRLHRELGRELEGYRARLLSAYDRHGTALGLREEEARERLRALGYIR